MKKRGRGLKEKRSSLSRRKGRREEEDWRKKDRLYLEEKEEERESIKGKKTEYI